eukprot:6018611-Pyramimonas_sp.AAC.2
MINKPPWGVVPVRLHFWKALQWLASAGVPHTDGAPPGTPEVSPTPRHHQVCCTVYEGRKRPKRAVPNVVNTHGRRGGILREGGPIAGTEGAVWCTVPCVRGENAPASTPINDVGETQDLREQDAPYASRMGWRPWMNPWSRETRCRTSGRVPKRLLTPFGCRSSGNDAPGPF